MSMEFYKSMIIVVNKSDTFNNDKERQQAFKKHLIASMPKLAHYPIVCCSALDNKGGKRII